MPRPTSFRLPEELLDRLEAEAAASESSTTSLVATLLDEGLKMRRFPGVVYRTGPAGRRAGLAAGPDVWEIIRAVRSAPGTGQARLRAVEQNSSVPLAGIRLAVDFYTAYPAEIDARIAADDQAAEEVRRMIERRERLLSG